MKFKRGTTLLGAMALAAMALMVMAGSALAWNTTSGGIKTSGTITIYKNGAEPKSCTVSVPNAGPVWTEGSENLFELKEGQFEPLRLNCQAGTGGTLMRWPASGRVKAAEGGYQATVISSGGEWYPSPYGAWVPSKSFVRPWVNASGGVPSHITMSNDPLGTIFGHSSEVITATGTLSFTTLFGGELTVP